jgi:crossover junction endodeoxyribonuclease RuvC
VRILAIDPGTQCGYSYRDERGNHTSGVWCLKGGRHEGGGMRFVRLRGYLNEIHRTYPIDAVAYEEVRGHKGTDAAHIYGGVLAVLTEFCEAEGIPYAGYPVGSIKRHATGKGNANKEAMVKASHARWPRAHGYVEDWNDNEADARWIAEYAASQLIKSTKAEVGRG